MEFEDEIDVVQERHCLGSAKNLAVVDLASQHEPGGLAFAEIVEDIEQSEA